jgi:hypothetical protein
MDKQSIVGTGLVFSNSAAHAAANNFGIAKTGKAIASLHGSAHAKATAAWVGFGNMKLGMFVMGAAPIVGAVLLLDRLCGREYGQPLIDWYEEAWKSYECQCELEEMKETVEIDEDHQLRATTVVAGLAQLEDRFRALEVENEVYQMKKQVPAEKYPTSQQSQATEARPSEKSSYDSSEKEFLLVKKAIRLAVSSHKIRKVLVNWKGEKRVALSSGLFIQEKGDDIHVFGSQFAKMLIFSGDSAESIRQEIQQIPQM